MFCVGSLSSHAHWRESNLRFDLIYIGCEGF